MIRVGQLPNRFGEGDKKHPRIPDFENINVTSSSRGIYSKLSPMKLGPFKIIEKIDKVELGYSDCGNGYQETIVNIFENYWQGSKIYKIDLIDGDVNNICFNNLKPSFFQRRVKMYLDTKPHRRALPKTNGYPIAGYYHGKIYDYVSSRKFYLYYYINLIKDMDEYKKLYNLYKSGTNLHIIGYDGRDIGEINKKSISESYYNNTKIFGHELVLAGMITNTLPEIIFDF